MRWYLNQNGETVGPLPEERIATLARWGKISPDAYVCDEQFSTWISIMRTAFGRLVTRAGNSESRVRSREHSSLASKWRAAGNSRLLLAGAVLVAGALLLALVTAG